jgi:hypothetical protein
MRTLPVALALLAACGSKKEAAPAPADAAAVAAPGPLVIVGRLDGDGIRADRPAPDCGTMHVAVPMRYAVVSVERGSYPDPWIIVVHGCPEMTRQMYGGADGGDLVSFRPGDLHRLELVPDVPSGVSVLEGHDYGATKRFWATRTDLGPECAVAMDCAPSGGEGCVRRADGTSQTIGGCACDAGKCVVGATVP